MITPIKTQKEKTSSKAVANNNSIVAGESFTKMPGIQTKLTIGEAGDRYEQEADRVADRVMTMSEPLNIQKSCSTCKEREIQRTPLFQTISPLIQRNKVQRQSRASFDLSEEKKDEPLQTKPEVQNQAIHYIQKTSEDEEELVQPKADDDSMKVADSSIERGINHTKGYGSVLTGETRSFMESRFGSDFSHVRIHSDNSAVQLNRQLNAQAFTKGSDIFFNQGRYSPESSAGKHLLAHELTHVIQQSGTSGMQMQSKHLVQRQADINQSPPGLPCTLETGPGHTPGTDVLFKEGKSTITPLYKGMLASFAATWLATGSKDTVFVNGYASTVGAQSTNWKLSCDRAQAVKNELVGLGIPEGKMFVLAHGESEEFSNIDAKQNQRVVVSSMNAPSVTPPPSVIPPQPAPQLIKNIKFTSDHGLLTDNNANWSDGGAVAEPEWITNPVQNKPISQTKNTKIAADITINAGAPGNAFDLRGEGVGGTDVSFTKTGNTSTGTDQIVSVTADSNLPDAVSRLARVIVWKIKMGGREQLAGYTGPHRIYVTYAKPKGSIATERRMDWCCQYANTANTPLTIADKIHPAVAGNTTFGGANTQGWDLLAGGSGDCDNLANLMCLAVKLLGVTSADVQLVRASTNAGAGNCLDLESRWFFGTEYLIMDFDIGPGRNWNAYEGCCETAGNYYAIAPFKKAANDYEMLKALTLKQYWVETNVTPGTSGWGVITAYSEVPKP